VFDSHTSAQTIPTVLLLTASRAAIFRWLSSGLSASAALISSRFAAVPSCLPTFSTVSPAA